MASEAMHPEMTCNDCGGRNVMPWWTSSDRWRLAMSTYCGGTPAKPGYETILCPACFVERWEKATGLIATWRLEPDPTTIRALGHDEWMAEHAFRQGTNDAVGVVATGDNHE